MPQIKQCLRLSALTLGAMMTASALVACSQLATPGLVRPNYDTETRALRAGEYSLDAPHSTLLFKVTHLGLSTYVGRFNTFSASLDFDPASISASRLEGSVVLSSIDVNDPAMTKRLVKKQWLHTDAYPEALFRSTSVDIGSDGDKPQLTFNGELSFRGVTQPVSLTGEFHGGADNLLTGKYTLGFSASGTFKRSDFGMKQYLGLVSDQVTIEIYAEFQRTNS